MNSPEANNSIFPLSRLHHGRAIQVVESDEDGEGARWRQWKLKERDDNAQFRRRLKVVLLDVISVVALGGGLLLAFRN